MSVGPERYVLTVLFRCSGVAVPNGPSLLRPRHAWEGTDLVIVLIVIIVFIISLATVVKTMLFARFLASSFAPGCHPMGKFDLRPKTLDDTNSAKRPR